MPFSLHEELGKKGFALSEQAFAQFERYYSLLVDWNERMNLTAITAYDEVMEKHFYDSVTPVFYHDFSQVDRIIDIGAGAGFPSIPIKLLFPHIEVTIVDSLNKRISFLHELAKELGLQGVHCVHGRAEDVGQNKQYREQYSLVLARAVARLPVLLELCLPFAQVGGTFIALKGSSGDEEVSEAQRAISVLGGELERVERLILPSEEANRVLVWVKKVKKTPSQYPRKAGTPNRSPIQ